MNNVLLDPLPETWTNAAGETFQLDTDFRIGIQICLLQQDSELTAYDKTLLIRDLLFTDDAPTDAADIDRCLQFFMNGWNHDKPSGKKEKHRLQDFDVDQWRIYAAFRSQYQINLTTEEMHWWEFMGLLSALSECAYTRVIDIRQKDIKPKMDKDSRKALQEAKAVYTLDPVLTHDEQALMDHMDDLLGQTAAERKRIEDFERYGINNGS